MSYQDNRIFILNEPNAPRINPALAVEIGLNESLLLLQIEFWISISNNERDGQQWTYQSTRDIQEKAFPFWSHHTINRAIKSLETSGYIITTTKYNTLKYDKTRWIALNFDELSKLKSISVKGYATGSTQNETGSNQNATTIPENTTEKKMMTEREPEVETGSTPQKEASPPPSSFSSDDLFQTIPEPFRKPSVKAVIARAIKSGRNAEYIRESIEYTVDNCKTDSWAKFKSYLGKCLDYGWGEGYSSDDNGKSEAGKRKAFLESRRSMPDSILKADAEKGCWASKQVLKERSQKNN